MEFYSRSVLDHFLKPRNPGELDAPDAEGTACDEAHQAACVFQLRVDAGHLAAVRFRTQGCVASIAASSALTDATEGLSLAEARRIGPDDVLMLLDGMPEDKQFSIRMVLRALARALDDYEERNGNG